MAQNGNDKYGFIQWDNSHSTVPPASRFVKNDGGQSPGRTMEINQAKSLFSRKCLHMPLDAIARFDELLVARREARATKPFAVFAEG